MAGELVVQAFLEGVDYPILHAVDFAVVKAGAFSGANILQITDNER